MYIYNMYIYIYSMARWLLWLSSGRLKKDSIVVVPSSRHLTELRAAITTPSRPARSTNDWDPRVPTACHIAVARWAHTDGLPSGKLT